MMQNSYFKLAQKAELKAIESISYSLSTIPETKKVVFFGSRARGDFSGASDLDVLVVISNIEVKNDVIRLLHDIELEYDVPLSPVIFTSKEYEKNKELNSSFIENIEREGIVLYEFQH